MRKTTFVTSAIFFLSLFAAAQKADFRLYTVADGLPQSIVHSVAQDAQGFIWLNAGQHLTRFDGANFQSHTNSSHPVFNRNREGFAEMQTDGDLLVYCLNGQIVSTNTLTGEETVVPVAGRLPAGYDDNYGHCVKLETGEVVAMYPDKAAGKVALLWLEKGKISHLVEMSRVNADRSNFYYTFLGDALGNLYFFSNGFDAILKFDRNGKKLQAFPIKNTAKNEVIRLLPGRGNSVLFIQNASIFRLENGAGAFQQHPANRLIQLGGNLIFDLAETPDGNFWAACSQRHLLFYDAKQDRLYDYNKELERLILNQTNLLKMHFDNSGAIWVSTTAGVLRVAPNTPLFDTYFTEQNALCGGYCSFRGFAEDGSGSIYASFYNSIFKINSPEDRQSSYAGLLLTGNFGPFDLLFYKGNLLLNSGTILDLKTGLMTKPFPNTIHTFDWGVFAYDAQDNIWWATGNKVFVLDDPDGSPAWKEIASIPEQGNIVDIAFDAHNGLFWFGNESSLWTLNPATGKLERHGESQPQLLTKLKCVYPNGKGDTWLGTEKGLVRYEYEPGKWHRYAQSDGLPNDIVVGILPEGDSCLWLSTYNGLSRFSTGSGRFLNFFKRDGLADNEFNRASHFTASDGRMYFGGVKGVTAFYPKEVMANFAKQKTTDRLLLRSVTLTEDGSDSSFTQLFPNPGQPLHVYHRNRSVFFDFGLLNHHENTQYSYMLDGLNEDWSAPARDNDLLFNSLPAGKYTFRVRAMDARGNWLADEIAFPLTVHPPWWASWWAYLLYFLTLTGIAYGIFYFLKKRWELQSQLQFEQTEALRLKELDSFKTRLYTNLTHEFRTPLTVILGMAQEGRLEIEKLQGQPISNFLISNFNLIERNGQSLLRLVNQLLDLSKLEDKTFRLRLQYGDVVPFLRYVVESFQSFASSKNLSLELSADLENLEMDFDPEQLQQVMSNLLSNAIKFTPAGGRVQVKLEIEKLEIGKLGGSPISQFPNFQFPISQFLISITDTGVGISEADLPHIFDRFYQADNLTTCIGEGTGIGLAHVLELVKLMQGTVSVESKLGEGTRFTVSLPVKKEAAAESPTSLEKSADFERRGFETPHSALTSAAVSVSPEKAGLENPAARNSASSEKAGLENPAARNSASPEKAGLENPAARNSASSEKAGLENPAARNSASPEKAGLENPAARNSASSEKAGLENPADVESFDANSLPYLLLIEDSPDVLTYLQTILAPSYQIETAANGALGIEAALERIPDLVISDVMMPEKDGYQVLDALKNDERTSHVPVVLLTAKADAASKIAGLRLGADAYLSKPFDKAELLATLGMMMENRRRLAAHFSSKNPPETAAPNGEAFVLLQQKLPGISLAAQETFLQKVHRIVAKNFADEDFGLPQLCQQVNMSRSQLFRKMKALTDEPPSDFIRNYRMRQAKTLLETTQLSVKEVAFRVGFRDLPHFSRTFQETFGAPPSFSKK